MKIGYSATFNFPNTIQPFEKHWVEDDELTHGLNLFEEITDEQLEQLTKNIRRIQYAIRKQVKDFAFESNGLDKKVVAETIQQKEVGSGKKNSDELIIEAIESMNDIKFLKIYEKHRDKSDAIRMAYDTKLESLTKK